MMLLLKPLKMFPLQKNLLLQIWLRNLADIKEAVRKEDNKDNKENVAEAEAAKEEVVSRNIRRCSGEKFRFW